MGKWAVKIWLQIGCFLAKLESLAQERQKEVHNVQQKYLQKLLKNWK